MSRAPQNVDICWKKKQDWMDSKGDGKLIQFPQNYTEGSKG
jgi:hypothetical protein